MKAHIVIPIEVEMRLEGENNEELMELFNAHAADLKFALRHETYTCGMPEIELLG